MAVEEGGDELVFWRFAGSFESLILKCRVSSFGILSKDFKTFSLMSIGAFVVLGESLRFFFIFGSLGLNGWKLFICFL